MFEDPTFWVAVAFVVFVIVALWFKVHKTLVGGLDQRAERIKAQLDEANSLREEAQKTLAEYQRKQHDAVAETEKIIAHAKEEAARMRKQAEQDLEHALARRRQQAEEKIAQAEAAALKELRGRAVDLAVAAAGRLITDTLDDKRAGKLIDTSIEDLSSKLN